MCQPQGKVFPENKRVSGSTSVPHQPLMQSVMAAGGTTQACSWLFRSRCNMVVTCGPVGITGDTRDLGFSFRFDFLKIISDMVT